jgi:hypothetical protein
VSLAHGGHAGRVAPPDGATGAGSNAGNYSDPTMDNLITERSGAALPRGGTAPRSRAAGALASTLQRFVP